MTDKKERILEVALRLFALEGYANVPTSKIAKAADVSEGLIFRHFGSKEALLDAILELGIEQVEHFVAEVKQETNPRLRIQKVIQLPLLVTREHEEFWKLQQSIKYHNPELATKYRQSEVFQSLVKSVEDAFSNLKYQNPKAETQLLMMIITNLFTIVEQEDLIIKEAFVKFVQSKYEE
ncbi:MAG: TetR/AcrR family transcriptional regulator [Saprospiraceae bacterium]|nr:TetR/AcrR family transcriptional regulator [Saprospiraceae bacterium]